MQLTAGIGKHRQAVKFVLVGVFADLKTASVLPVFLGAQFYGFGVVSGAHRCRVSSLR